MLPTDDMLNALSDLTDFDIGIQQDHPIVEALATEARGMESDIDSDHDGSLLDEAAPAVAEWMGIKDSPVVGRLASLGDGITDALGTRDQGIFSEAGTLDPNHKDVDEQYKGDGVYKGLGYQINQATGLDVDLGQVVPAAGEAFITSNPLMAPVYGAALAMGGPGGMMEAHSAVSSVVSSLDPFGILRGADDYDESEY